MTKNIKTSLFGMALAAGLLSILAACPAGAPGMGSLPGGSRSSSVDPNTCGNYAATDAGRKLKAFLEATVALDAAVSNTDDYLRETCAMMAQELSISTEGDTRTVCMAVRDGLRHNMQVGLTAGARLDINYKPAVCTVNVEAAAEVAAQCEAKASADIEVRCEGTCQGTCQGTCDGACSGAAAAGTGGGGAAGQCNGTCEGRCQGSCSGGCDGHADVQADASCKAKAEVQANVQATCTEPELDITFDAAVVVDKSKLDAAVAALRKGLPRILMIQVKMTGPVQAAFQTWTRTAANMVAASNKLMGSLGDQALCVAGQIKAAVGMQASIMASINVQVEVSAEVSASASGGASASRGAGSSTQIAGSPARD